jgi:hypothetical protein
VATREPDTRVRRPVLRGGCRDITFVSWRCGVDDIARRLPEGLEVDVHDGSAWVSIVPFVMTAVRPPGAPRRFGVAYLETNLRTYVRDRHGRDGIWFFSVDVSSGVVAASARVLGAPARAARLQVTGRDVGAAGGAVRYTGRHAVASYELDVRVHDAPARLGDTTIWLTGRWRAFARSPFGLTVATVVHEPWPLLEASLTSLDESLTSAAGVPPPDGDPVVHYAPAIEQLRAALPRLVRA